MNLGIISTENFDGTWITRIFLESNFRFFDRKLDKGLSNKHKIQSLITFTFAGPCAKKKELKRKEKL